MCTSDNLLENEAKIYLQVVTKKILHKETILHILQ